MLVLFLPDSENLLPWRARDAGLEGFSLATIFNCSLQQAFP
jgi:hypothetical protein